jgi:hypothetical protein
MVGNVLISVIALTFVVAFVAPFLIRELLHYRRSLWIAANPVMHPVELSELPPAAAAYFDTVRPTLEELGFRVAVVAHAPAFGAGTTWSQVLLLNRPQGDRASIGCFTEASAGVGLTFATEFAGGPRIVTDSADVPEHGGAGATPGVTDPADRVRGVYGAHRDKVANAAREHPGLEKVLPEDGAELDWVQSKAALVAGDLAKGRFARDRTGLYYRPTWTYAARCVRDTWPGIPVRRPRPAPAGFPVAPPRTR